MNNKKASQSLLSKPAVQSILAAILCIIIGLFVGYVALLLIDPRGATDAIVTILKN